jgi:hypothetical protein
MTSPARMYSLARSTIASYAFGSKFDRTTGGPSAWTGAGAATGRRRRSTS